MTFYDGMQDLFRTLGMNEEQARIAACGRQYRSEAEARAAEVDDLRAEAAEAAEVYAATASMPVPAPVVQDRGLTEGREAATAAAQSALRMNAVEAAAYVARLEVREVNRGGPSHAGQFLKSFAAGLASGSPVGARVMREAVV